MSMVTAVLGLLTGALVMPLSEWTLHALTWRANLSGLTFRTATMFLVATLVMCSVAGALILVPGYLLGVMPLRQNKLAYFLSLAMGVTAYRLWEHWCARKE